MIKTTIVVDAIIFEIQKRGGISRIYKEILPRICDLDDSIKIKIFSSGRVLQPLPKHSNLEYSEVFDIRKIGRRNRMLHTSAQKIFEQLIRYRFDNGSKSIWHSTYFTYVSNWQGPVVVTVHDMIYEQFPDLFNRKYDQFFKNQKRKCILQADIVICDSIATRDDVCQYLGIQQDRCEVIYPAYNQKFHLIDHDQMELFALSKGPYILFVGKRSMHKNFSSLLRAYHQWDDHKRVRLVIVGNDPFTEDESRLLNKLSIHDRIDFIENPTDEKLCVLYNGALAFIYPSLHEGFGIPLLEAMSCGCPIVASDIPSTLEVAKDVPIYFKPEDVDQLVAALTEVISEGRNSKRVEHGFKVVIEYSWKKTASETLEVYHSLT